MILSLKDYITSRGKYPAAWDEFRALPNKEELEKAALLTIAKAAMICDMVRVDAHVTSGWRSHSHNKAIGGSEKSKHLYCQAIDLWDPAKRIGEWCVDNIEVLMEQGLYMESLTKTHAGDDYKKWWVHLQTVPPRSGNRIFLP